MATILLSSQPATGHLNPVLAIARRLRERGHEVAFTCHGPPAVEEKITGQGFTAHRLPDPIGSLGFLLLPYTSGFFETYLATRLFFAGLVLHARAIQQVGAEVGAGAVVHDFGLPAAGVAAEGLGIPHISVFSAGLCHPGPGIPPWGSGLPIGGEWGRRGRLLRWLSTRQRRAMNRKLARACRKLGARDVTPAPWPSSRWLTLLASVEAAEAPRDPFPPCDYFVGPCFAGRGQGGQDGGFPFERLSVDLPKVYVSLGTVFNKKPKAFRRIIDGFADGRCQVVVSAGGAYKALSAQDLPEHVLLFERVPQVALLSRMDAVISHGGNNTVNETLAAGKPLLVMPVGGEQADNASRVVHLGAGLRADLRRSGSTEIGAKVRRLVDEASFAQRAQELAEAIGRSDGADVSAQLIERLVETGQPLTRPEGAPLTIERGGPFPWEGTPG